MSVFRDTQSSYKTIGDSLMKIMKTTKSSTSKYRCVPQEVYKTSNYY